VNINPELASLATAEIDIRKSISAIHKKVMDAIDLEIQAL
jgi:hypothetical protein